MQPTHKRIRRFAVPRAGSSGSYFSRRRKIRAVWLYPLLSVLLLAGLAVTIFAQPTLSSFASSIGYHGGFQLPEQGTQQNTADNQTGNQQSSNSDKQDGQKHKSHHGGHKGDTGNQNTNNNGGQNTNTQNNTNNNGNQNNNGAQNNTNNAGNQNNNGTQNNTNNNGNQANNNNQGQNTPNPDCTLIIPNQPLTAQGLATPYQLTATDRAKGQCHESNNAQTAFVQAAVLNPANGQISVYNPLVVDRGSQPAAAPVVPKLPQNAVVGIWFGFNGSNLSLKNFNDGLQSGVCVNGLNDSIFGQYAYCNAPAFFSAANKAIKAGTLKVPALGTANDGLTCPTTRDFSVVDQDQSDNVTTKYLINSQGQTAQLTASNQQQLPDATLLVNGSDNGLLDNSIDKALNCQSWTAPDLANPGQSVPALPLNELQADAHQAAPIALVPAGDPMALVDDHKSLEKTNLYRAGVDQPAAKSLNDANTATYCQNLLQAAPKRIFLDRASTSQLASPDTAAANNLFTFLAQRFNASWTNLKCDQLTGLQSPITLTTDGNNVTTDATLGKALPKDHPNSSKKGRFTLHPDKHD